MQLFAVRILGRSVPLLSELEPIFGRGRSRNGGRKNTNGLGSHEKLLPTLGSAASCDCEWGCVLRAALSAKDHQLTERSPSEAKNGKQRQRSSPLNTQHSHTGTPRAWLSLSLAFSQQKLQDKSDVALKETGGSLYINFLWKNSKRFLRTFHFEEKISKD